jgi:hypothetical protein
VVLGQVKSRQVKCSRVPVPVPVQVPVPVPVPESQWSTNEAAGRRCFQETEGAGHPAGIMPFDRLEGMRPGRERPSLCNASTGNGRSLRCGRRRRGERGRGGGGLAVGCGLWAAGCGLLAVSCWLLAVGFPGDLSLLPTGHGPGPSLTHSQHTLRCQPACLPLPFCNVFDAGRGAPQRHMSSLRGRCSGRWALQSGKCSISGNQRLLVRRGPRLCLGRRLGVPGRVRRVHAESACTRKKVLGRAPSHHASLVVYSPVINTCRREDAPSVHQQLNSS